MGLRDAFSKPGGGGRLNGVDGKIVDYQLSTEFPYKAKDGRKPKKDAYPSLWLNLEVLADGTEESTIEPLFAGDSRQWDISDDGHSLTPNEDAEGTPRLFGNAPRFLNSMFDNGFDEIDYEDGGEIDLSSIINQRCRFVQVVDEAANAKKGKRVDPKDPKRTYDNKTLEVSEVYGEDDSAPAKKANGKAAPAAKANGKGKTAPKEDDFTEEATTTLMAILEANDGEINRNKLGMQASKILLKAKSENREAVIDVLKSEDFLETEDGWSFTKKTGVIEAA